MKSKGVKGGKRGRIKEEQELDKGVTGAGELGEGRSRGRCVLVWNSLIRHCSACSGEDGQIL